VVIFPLSSICFNIVSLAKLNKVADKGSPCLTPHFTINSSVISLFTLTVALVCVKVKAINLINLEHQISLNILLVYSYKQSQKHVCNPQICYTINIMLMAFLKDLSYNKNIVYNRSIWAKPHLIIVQFIFYILH